MRVTARLFAIVRERAGVSEAVIELPAGATVAAARDALAERFPPTADALRRCAFAVNRAHGSLSTSLNDGDEVAVIPPVSGG
jgi:molybdopterin converting factor subunit 1